MGVPVGGFEEDHEEGGAAEDGVHGEAFEEAVEGVGAALSEVGAEAVAADVFWEVVCGVSFLIPSGARGGGGGGGERHGEERTHFVFVWEGRHGAGGVLACEHLVEEDKVGEAATDADLGFLERWEVSLRG